MKHLTWLALMSALMVGPAKADPIRYQCVGVDGQKLRMTINDNRISLSGAERMKGTRYVPGNEEVAKKWAYFFNVKENVVNQEVLVGLELLKMKPGKVRYLTMDHGLQSFREYECPAPL